MPRFSTGQAEQPDKLDQHFSFTGKIRGADVLLRLVEVCGFDALHQRLNDWQGARDAFAIAGALDILDAKDMKKPVKEKPVPKRRKSKSANPSK